MSPKERISGDPLQQKNRALERSSRARRAMWTTVGRYGEEHFSEIARKGGKAVVKKYGRNHMVEIGRRGGVAVRDTYNSIGPFYSRIARWGNRKRAERRANPS